MVPLRCVRLFKRGVLEQFPHFYELLEKIVLQSSNNLILLATNILEETTLFRIPFYLGRVDRLLVCPNNF